MGWFSKKPHEPVIHPRVERIVHVPAPATQVLVHLDEYSGRFPARHSTGATVTVANSGGWTAIRLPDAVHPWQLHNLAFWMLDCPEVRGDVIAHSGAGPGHGRYRLVRDPELPDALCGWDEDGNGWTVNVPDNEIVRGEDVPVSRSLVVPAGYHEWSEVAVRFDDPGRGMNPGNESTARSRTGLRRTVDVVGG